MMKSREFSTFCFVTHIPQNQNCTSLIPPNSELYPLHTPSNKIFYSNKLLLSDFDCCFLILGICTSG